MIDTNRTPGPHQGRRRALAGLSLCTLLATFGTSSVNVALPAFEHAFGATFQQVQWIVLAYLLTLTSLVVGVGRLGDVIGRRRLLLVGISLFTAASLACAAAPSFWLLLAGRAGQGFGAAVMMALSMALVGENSSSAKSASAMGLLGTMSAVGTALGPSLGGLLLAAWGWPAMFLINFPLGTLAFFLVHRAVSSEGPGREDGAHFDCAGAILLALTLAAYALAMTMGRGRFDVLNGALFLAAAAGLVLFLQVEKNAQWPLVPTGVLRRQGLGAGLAMSSLVSAVVMATLVVGPFFLGGALGLDAAQAGLVLAAGPAGAAVMALPAGRLADRFGSRRVAIAGLSGMFGASLLLSHPIGTSGTLRYLLCTAFLTGSYALFQTANNTAVMSQAGAGERGTVSAMLNLSRNLGLITGASLMGALFAWAAGSPYVGSASPLALAAAVQLTFGIAASLLAVALTIATARALREAGRPEAAVGPAATLP